ncbi:MAG TPA: GAF domain-containing protein, partial [Bacillota bacterium]|nr:GAF domain-containing protein [Bacillota bacterium]
MAPLPESLTLMLLDLALVAALGASLLHYRRHPDALSGEIVSMLCAFAALALPANLSDSTDLWRRAAVAAGVAIFLLQPYLLIRVLGHIRVLDPRVRTLMLAPLPVFWAHLALGLGATGGPWALAIGAYLLPAEIWGGIAFVVAWRRRAGVSRYRMMLAAVGTFLLSAAVVVASLAAWRHGFYTPAVTAPLAIPAVCCYYLAFATPDWLRRWWAAPVVHRYVVAQFTARTAGAAEVRATLARVVCDAVDGRAAFIARPSARGDTFIMEWLAGHTPTGHEPTMIPGGGAIARTAREAHGLHAAGPDLDVAEARLLAAVGSSHLLAVPFAAEDRPIGVLVIVADHGWIFPADELAVIGELAHYTAMVLNNAELLAETRRQARRLDALQRVTGSLVGAPDLEAIMRETLDAVLSVAGAGVGEIFLADAAVGVLRRRARRVRPDAAPLELATELPLDQGVLAESLRSGRIIYSPDVTHDPHLALPADAVRSFLAVPLRSGGRTIGVLVLLSASELNHDADELELLDAMAVQIATAFERGRLFSELAESEARLRA